MSDNKIVLNVTPTKKVKMTALPASLSKTDVERAEVAAENSLVSANSAALSASSAAEAEEQAELYANLAQRWAESAESPDGKAGSKSAKTWAAEALMSAANAADSAETAKAFETAAAASASAASTSESNAAASATAAASSTTIAAQQATTATTKASEAASAAGNALSYKNAASTSATNAANSASEAKSSESNSAGSAIAAAESAASAAESAEMAAKNAAALGNPVNSVAEADGVVTVTKTDGSGNTFNVVKSVNGSEPVDGNVTVEVPDTMPVGTVLAFAGITIPDGYLNCNGATVSRTTYSALFAAISTTYGSGDGSTTFNLPNYTGYKFVTSATVSVLGNGKTLGLTDGSNNCGLGYFSSVAFAPATSYYNANIGSTGGSYKSSYKSFGVVKNASTSGLTGTVSTANLKWIIKY